MSHVLQRHVVPNVVSAASACCYCCASTHQMPDCQQVLPSDGVSAWTGDLSHSQWETQQH